MSAITTEERRAHIIRLKAEGLTYRQIAERIGLSRTHVVRLASPRAYETNLRLAREAKRRLRGTCEDCGAETKYSGHGQKISTRCAPCAARRSGIAARGTGPVQTRVMEYIGDGERRYMEIANGCSLTKDQVAQLLDRMRKHGLLERPRRGVYRKASA